MGNVIVKFKNDEIVFPAAAEGDASLNESIKAAKTNLAGKGKISMHIEGCDGETFTFISSHSTKQDIVKAIYKAGKIFGATMTGMEINRSGGGA